MISVMLFNLMRLLCSCMVVLMGIVMAYTWKKYRFWHERGFLFLETQPLLGNWKYLRTVHSAELFEAVYSRFRGKAKVAGAFFFTRPVAIVLDLDVAKAILIKDFNNFTDRLAAERLNEETDPLNAHLFGLPGDQWRALRTKLTPTFTSGQMRFMFPTVVGVAGELEAAFDRALTAADEPGVIEMHELMASYTTDVIGTCAFGVECNSLKDAKSEFRQFGRSIFYSKCRSQRGRLFKAVYLDVLKYFGYLRVPRSLTKFFIGMVEDTVRTREKMNIQRKDFLQLLLQLKNEKTNKDGLPALTLHQMAAQMFIFFVAGFETSSSNMSFCLFELAKNQRVQEKLRASILAVLQRYDDQPLCYEALMEMTYLNQVMDETLRMYPALSNLMRYPKEDYRIPDSNLVIPKGVRVSVPIKAIHYDPEYYEKPFEFRPERFDSAEVKLRHPQAFLGFGDGPRNCIGLRFARMQVRIGLVLLLKSFRFSVSPRTPSELAISGENSVMCPKNGVWLHVERI